jgi:hypothetical protein
MDAVLLDELVPVVEVGRAFDPRCGELLKHGFNPWRPSAWLSARGL